MPQHEPRRNDTRSETVALVTEYEAKLAALAETFQGGTHVTITITATVEQLYTWPRPTLWVRTPNDDTLHVNPLDPDVHVVAIEPERPSLEQVLMRHESKRESIDSLFRVCTCGDEPPRGFYGSDAKWHAEHVAAALAEAGVAR